MQVRDLAAGLLNWNARVRYYVQYGIGCLKAVLWVQYYLYTHEEASVASSSNSVVGAVMSFIKHACGN